MPSAEVRVRRYQWSQGRICHLRKSEWDVTNGHKVDYTVWGSRSEMVPMVTRQIMPSEGVRVRWYQWSQGKICHLRESEWDGGNGHKADYAVWGSQSEMVPMVTRQIMPSDGVRVRWYQWSQGRLCRLMESVRWYQWSQGRFCRLMESEWDDNNGHKADYAVWGSQSELVLMVTR